MTDPAGEVEYPVVFRNGIPTVRLTAAEHDAVKANTTFGNYIQCRICDQIGAQSMNYVAYERIE